MPHRLAWKNRLILSVPGDTEVWTDKPEIFNQSLKILTFLFHFLLKHVLAI
jgi:hypothetical protein